MKRMHRVKKTISEQQRCDLPLSPTRPQFQQTVWLQNRKLQSKLSQQTRMPHAHGTVVRGHQQKLPTWKWDYVLFFHELKAIDNSCVCSKNALGTKATCEKSSNLRAYQCDSRQCQFWKQQTIRVGCPKEKRIKQDERELFCRSLLHVRAFFDTRINRVKRTTKGQSEFECERTRGVLQNASASKGTERSSFVSSIILVASNRGWGKGLKVQYRVNLSVGMLAERVLLGWCNKSEKNKGNERKWTQQCAKFQGVCASKHDTFHTAWLLDNLFYRKKQPTAAFGSQFVLKNTNNRINNE